MEHQIEALSADDTFAFGCHAAVPCFNHCCRDLNQHLTPYDILRLKTALGLRSNQLLLRYCSQHTGPQSGLPVISLKADPANGRVCPFVTPDGCRVYAHRPGSCRMYPLMRAVSRSRQSGRLTAHYALLSESHCRGFEGGSRQTVRQWLADQGLAEYNRINDRLLEIISLKNQRAPGPLDIRSRHIFHLACYDLDTFRDHIFDKGLLNGYPGLPDDLEHLRDDDTALLELGMRWVKFTLFDTNRSSYET